MRGNQYVGTENFVDTKKTVITIAAHSLIIFMMQGSRWCFTLNNYTDADISAFHNATDRAFVIIGKEVGANGTPHLQGYITFQAKKSKRLAAVRAIHPRAHWELARGSTDENIIYCSKEGDFHEIGERPKVGSRGKFVDAVAMIVAGEKIKEVAIENPEAYARGNIGLRALKYTLSEPYEHNEVRPPSKIRLNIRLSKPLYLKRNH